MRERAPNKRKGPGKSPGFTPREPARTPTADRRKGGHGRGFAPFTGLLGLLAFDWWASHRFLLPGKTSVGEDAQVSLSPDLGMEDGGGS